MDNGEEKEQCLLGFVVFSYLVIWTISHLATGRIGQSCIAAAALQRTLEMEVQVIETIDLTLNDEDEIVDLSDEQIVDLSDEDNELSTEVEIIYERQLHPM